MGFFARFWDGLTNGARSFTASNGMVEPIYLMPETDTFGKYKDPASYLATSNAVYVCNRLRAQMLASLKPKLYRVARDGTKTDVTSGDLYELLQKVNPFWTFRRLIEMTEMSLGVYQQGAFWVLERGTQAQRRRVPQELWWVPPDRMQVIRSGASYISHFEYQPTDGSRPIRFERDEVIWFRYPNVINEFVSLPPISAAMIAADTAYAAMYSNAMLFRNGAQVSGVIGPKAGTTLTEEQAQSIETSIARRFRGMDKAHRLAVFRFETSIQPLSITPKDAEFLGTLGWGLEEIARAYGVPLDLVGGQRTYENYNAAQLDLWIRTLIPEARFIADELTEQLLPHFPGQADLIEFDASDVLVLQEAEREKWAIEKEQLDRGVLLQNEWREEQGLDPLPWGDAWWAPATLTPIMDATKPDPPAPPALPPAADGETEPERARMLTSGRSRAVAYDSPEHRQLMRRFEQRAKPHDEAIGAATAELMRRQRQAVKARLTARAGARDDAAEVADNPFDLPRWIKTFRLEVGPLIEEAVDDLGQQALDDLGLSISFDIGRPDVINAIERQVQQFAQRVNQTTWDALKTSLSEGTAAGESVTKLTERVEAVMGDRIRSSGETIARTETNRASTTGDLEAWRQSGVVAGKRWLSALDSRTRETHVAAHGQRRRLDEDFTVGDATGPGPGLLGVASEVVNCRCTMTAIIDVEWEGDEA
jgi:HK97 family phage portal protein